MIVLSRFSVNMYTYSGVNVAVLNDVCKLVYYYMKQNATCDCCQQYWNVNYLYILGLPTLGIGPLQPLAISEINIGQGNGPVNIRQDYTNIKLHGLCDSVLTTYK